MRILLLARHGQSLFNVDGIVNGDPALDRGLSPLGASQAAQLEGQLAALAIDLCVTSEFPRAKDTARLALGDRADATRDDRRRRSERRPDRRARRREPRRLSRLEAGAPGRTRRSRAARASATPRAATRTRSNGCSAARRRPSSASVTRSRCGTRSTPHAARTSSTGRSTTSRTRPPMSSTPLGSAGRSRGSASSRRPLAALLRRVQVVRAARTPLVDHGGDGGRPARLAVDAQRPSDQVQPLPHRLQADVTAATTPRPRMRVEAAAVVLHPDEQSVRIAAELDRDAARGRVPRDVRERLAQHPVDQDPLRVRVQPEISLRRDVDMRSPVTEPEMRLPAARRRARDRRTPQRPPPSQTSSSGASLPRSRAGTSSARTRRRDRDRATTIASSCSSDCSARSRARQAPAEARRARRMPASTAAAAAVRARYSIRETPATSPPARQSIRRAHSPSRWLGVPRSPTSRPRP